MTRRRRATLRTYFFTGLAIWLPVIVTVYLLRLFFLLADSILGHSANVLLQRWYGRSFPGLGLLLALLLLPLTGYVASQFFARRFVEALERWFGNLPIVRYIYPPAKQMADLIFTEEQRVAFRRVVLVPYPSHGLYSLGFVTNEVLPALDAAVNNHLVAVLVPSTPSPLTGYTVFVPASEVVAVDVSVEEGMALIISAGVVGPGKDLQGPASRWPRLVKR